jgi:hypothetical protein
MIVSILAGASKMLFVAPLIVFGVYKSMLSRIIGILLIAFSFVFNPWLLETYIVLDGKINSKQVYLIGQVVFLIAGLWLLIRRVNRSSQQVSSKEITISLSLIVLFVMASALAFEGLLRVAFDPSLVLDGERWSEFVWRKRQADEGAKHLQSSYQYDRFDATLGWLPQPNYRSESIQTNALGIRANREYDFDNLGDKKRIVFIGDSYTWGERTWNQAIYNHETFVAQLENLLTGVETINLGVHGWGTDQQLLYLQQFGFQFEPDLVVLGFFEGDMPRNIVNFFGYMKPRFELENGRLTLMPNPILEPEKLLEREFDMPRSYLFALIVKGVNHILNKTKLRPLKKREEWMVTEAIFDQIKKECENRGSEFILVNIPLGVHEKPSPVESAVSDWAERTKTHYVGLREAFDSLPEADKTKIYDGHFTPFGHQVTANAIASLIENENLFPEHQH